MNNLKIPLWIAVALMALSMVLDSCIEDDFTTSPGDVLDFNMDTVAFDTVITLQGTATKQLVVYNHSRKQINISSIKVAGISSKGHFYLNVDGIKGDTFHDVEIRGNDSIYIFIEAKLDEMEQDSPTWLEDRLEFVTNGMSQKVSLTAWGQDVIRLVGDTIDSNRRFTANKPYLIYDTLFVAPDDTLTLDAGTTLLFHDKAALRCAGTMIANGTAEAPITFRGDRLDHIVGETGFDMMSGQWGGIIFTPPTTGNVLRHVVMKGSTIGMHCSDTAYSENSKCALKLVNCVLTNSATNCLVTSACYVEAIGTEFSDAAQQVFYVTGGKVVASHCTFANNYLFDLPSDTIVNVFDVKYNDGTIGKVKADFNNCIIYGMPPEINKGVVHMDVYLRYCLLKSKKEDDAHFINCIWGDPCFLTMRDDQLFDYRLGNESGAIGKGNPALCPDEARYDRYGYDRLARDSVDLGAYVWMPAR